MNTLNEAALKNGLVECLSLLIESSFLDATLLANDCIDNFYNYEWEQSEDLDDEQSERWELLHEKGCVGEITNEELTEFIMKTKPSAGNHTYYHRIQSRLILDLVRDQENT